MSTYTDTITIIQPVNLLTLKNWVPWFINFHRETNCNTKLYPVHGPKWMLVSALPDDIKESITNDIYDIEHEYNFGEYEHNMFTIPITSLLEAESFNSEHFKNFKKVINMLEKIRGNSLEKLAPEYYQRMFKMG